MTRVKGSHRPLMQKEVEVAIANSKSASGAAKWLNVSYPMFRKYAKAYGLLDGCRNPGGKGVNRVRRKGSFGLDSILAGEHPRYERYRLKERIIAAGYLKNECCLCGFKQPRVLDGRIPLQLVAKDGDLYNLKLENLDLRCLNCVFLTTGKVRDSSVIPLEFNADLLNSGHINMDDIDRIQREVLAEMDDK